MGVFLQAKLSLVNGISQKDLPGIFATSGDGLVSLDLKGRFQNLNSAAEQLLGWNAAELQGVDFFAHSRFSLDHADSVSSGSPCAALASVTCPHFNVNGRITDSHNQQLIASFMLVPIREDERAVGKLFVFNVLGQPVPETKGAAAEAQEIIDAAASIVIKLDAKGEVCFINRQAQWLLGDSNETSLLPESISTLLMESPHLLDQQTLFDRRVVEGHEKELCIAWSVAVLRDVQGEVSGAVCVGNDFTDHHHSLKGQLHESQTTQMVYEHINDGVITLDSEGRVSYLNAHAEQLTGWSNAEARGKLLADIYHILDEQTLKVAENLVEQCFREGKRVSSQCNRVLLRRGGWEFIVTDNVTPLHDAEGQINGAVMMVSDVSELRGMEHRLEYEASHDSLTGLINRRQFGSHLQVLLDTVRGGVAEHALLYMDLDQFKLINDSYGHSAGDQLLKELSALLVGHLAEGDSLARLGGDEFGVILANCPLDTARIKARALCHTVRDYCFYWEDKPFDIGVSIGLVAIDGQEHDFHAILSKADSACHVAKQQGRNRVHVYQRGDLALSRHDGEIRWTQRIRAALKDNRFQLYCQNIVPLSEKLSSNTHYEILLRMIDDDGKVLRPAAFIAAAERYHLMPAIDRWVITNAMQLLGERRARGESNGIFSINISGQSLDDEEFIGFVVDQFDQGHVPAEMICFEITETTAATSLMVVQRFIAVLRGMGCKFALDDFGRGISSFAYLKNLNVDYLKIDGMFVRDLADDKVGHAMVESINNISHIMGVQTIAEFVETSEVLEKLVAMGVDHVQGYQLGHPRPLMPAFRASDQMH